ncbi:MAG: hypothetical protein HYT27_01440 [Parcubacteria group bacterium]|nr:hypothetical protein [Parcubacteria group bacterium]
MNIKETLSELGLQEKESRIYVAALELGATSATDIARKAGVQRTHFYDIVEKLLAMGLMRQTAKGKHKLFSAANPEELLEVQKEKLKKLETVLPELKALYKTVGEKPRVFYFEGQTGIDQINDDSLRYKGEMVGFTTPRFVVGHTRSTGKEFIKKRVALGKHSRVIGENSPEIHELQSRDKSELRETRILSPDVFRSDIEIVIYGNKVAFVDYKEEWGLIIEGIQIVSVLKMIFEIVWSKWET